jgi:hypothetical protein
LKSGSNEHESSGKAQTKFQERLSKSAREFNDLFGELSAPKGPQDKIE